MKNNQLSRQEERAVNLLIVDDEPLEREVLLAIIQRSNLPFKQIFEAKHGAEAIDIVATTAVDVLVIDIQMPKMDGLRAAKIIKTINPHIKVIFLTAFNEFDYALQTIRIGAEDYLLKPASAGEIIRTLEKAINNSRGKIEETSSFNIVMTLKDYIKNHLSEKLTIEALAKKVHLHPQYVSRLFKQQTNYSLSEYIISERLEKSKKLLLQTEYTITEIAGHCGFSDSNYFTRVFKKHEGVPPSEFRKNELFLREERLKSSGIHYLL